MSLNFRPIFGWWFGGNSGTGCSLLVLWLALGCCSNLFSQQAPVSEQNPVPEQSAEPDDEPGQPSEAEVTGSLDGEANPDAIDNSPEATTAPLPVADSTEEDAINTEFQQVVVAAAFVNLMSGPGRGYPVFYVAEQKESIWVLFRRTNWFKVRIAKGKEGWVHISDMQKMENLDGSSVNFGELTQADFIDRSWELGFRAGDFAGAKVLAFSGTWQFTENLALELVVGQGLGSFSKTQQATIDLIHSPFPEWRVSPYFGVGAGAINTLPSASLVQEVDRQDEVLFVNSGIKTYITDRFLFRLEYRNYVILTTQETNEEVDEWTAGFSVFF